MDILSWDIESSSLNADYGVVLCVGMKTVGKGKPVVRHVGEFGFPQQCHLIEAERRLLKEVGPLLSSADSWLTWFGTYFDVPFVNSRLLYHHLPLLPASQPHIDGWKTAKARLKLRNNRLLTVQSFLGLEEEKNAILGPEWIKAVSGDKRSLGYVVEHCRRDVVVLEQAYDRLRPLIVDHPNKGVIDAKGGCPVCGKDTLQRRGWHVTRTRRYQRFQCTSCGAWSKAAKPDRVADRRPA